jgi:hypothetical protein
MRILWKYNILLIVSFERSWLVGSPFSANCHFCKVTFDMQPYFDPTRKTTSKKLEADLKKNQKLEDNLKTNENGRPPQ